MKNRRGLVLLRKAAAFIVSAAFSLCLAAGGALPVTADDYSYISGYSQEVFDSTNDFPSSEANAVLQTSDGFIWFATYQGLVRYDGSHFICYNAKSGDGFPSSNVRDLYEDGKKRLWIATNDCGVVCYENGEYKTYGKADGVPSNSVRSITENQNGDIICGSTDGMFKITPNGEVKRLPLDGDGNAFVNQLDCDKNGIVYAVLSTSELVIYDSINECVLPYDTVKIDPNPTFSAVCAASDGKIYLGIGKSTFAACTFDGKTLTAAPINTGKLLQLNVSYEDNVGNVWIGAENGLAFVEKLTGKLRFVDASAIGDTFSGIYQDYEGGYWFTSTTKGVLQLTKSNFTNLTFSYCLSEIDANVVIKSNGCWYIGTNSGMTICDITAGKTVENSLTALLSGVRVRGAICDSEGYIWICTYNECWVVKYNPKDDTYRIFDKNNGITEEKTRCALELQSGAIAIGTANGAFFIKDDKVISAAEALGADSEPDLPRVMILCFYQAEDGTLYLGTDGNGIYKAEGGKVTHIDEINGLNGGVILRMAPDEDSCGLWVSDGAGLSHLGFDNDEIKNIGWFSGVSILDIVNPGNGEVWLLTTNTIYRASEETLLSNPDEPELETIDKSDGLSSSIKANAWTYLDDAGTLYLCCAQSVSAISTKDSATGGIVPRVAITSIEADGTKYPEASDKITLPSDTVRLTIHATLLAFGMSDSQSVEYYLEGQDTSPVKVTKSELDSSGISYTNLRGGSYTFHIRSIGLGGESGHEKKLTIVKELQFFENTYVQVGICVLIALVIIGAVTAVMRARRKIYLKKQSEYKGIIVQAISAISNTIDAKDPYTRGHSVRVAAYSAEIAKRMGQKNDFVENIYYIGLLHDIGKIGIPTEIITKPSKLTDEEYAIMKQHPTIGYEILKDITTIKNIAIGARDHHEHFDGNGYNKGLRGEEISIEARIICGADSYDAMSSKRSYRDGLPQRVILEEFKRCRGTQFDPEVADVVIKMIEEGAFDKLNVDEMLKLGANTFVTGAEAAAGVSEN